MAKRTLSAKQKAALARGRKIRAANLVKRTVNPRKRRKAKKSASHKEHTTMPYALIANPRKRRRRRKATNPARRRRHVKARRTRNPKRKSHSRSLARRTHPTVTVINPKKRRRSHARRTRNPSGSQIMDSLKESALPSLVGAGAGFGLAVLDTKVLHRKPMFSLLAKVGLSLTANIIFANHQKVAHAISAASMASVGYSMGIKTMGGMVAMDQGAMLEGMAAMAEEDSNFAALLQDAGVGALLTGVDPGMGAAEQTAAEDYATALGDSDDGYGIGSGEEDEE